jgi:hypothetical protein
MTHTLDRRRFTAAALLALAGSVHAVTRTDDGAMIDFDALYIPPLFLTGAAAKSPEGPARAQAALARLQGQWPALRGRLEAVWPRDTVWLRTVGAVQGQLADAARHAGRGAWPESHEALEQVRMALWRAREARGMDYVLDRFVAFHEPMERLADAAVKWTPSTLGPRQRAELEKHFVEARARWRPVEALPLDAAALRLTPVREAQLRKAMTDESAALQALSEALRGADAAALLKTAAATKPPFVRAYTAFGLAEGDALPQR